MMNLIVSTSTSPDFSQIHFPPPYRPPSFRSFLLCLKKYTFYYCVYVGVLVACMPVCHVHTVFTEAKRRRGICWNWMVVNCHVNSRSPSGFL